MRQVGLNLSKAYRDTPGHVANKAIGEINYLSERVDSGSGSFASLVRVWKLCDLISMNAQSFGLDGMDKNDLEWAKIHLDNALRRRGFTIDNRI